MWGLIMKYMWAVCDVEADGKYYAYPIRISVADNLLSKLTIKAIHTLSVYDNRTKKEWNQNHIHERGIEWLLNMDDMKETLNWNLNGDSSKYQFKWAQTANGYSEGYAYIYD